MELTQEIYTFLQETNQEWPQHALCVMRDADGDIKFSSKTKSYITFDLKSGIYSRGEDCMINTNIEIAPEFKGSIGCPDIITRAAYENYYFSTK